MGNGLICRSEKDNLKRIADLTASASLGPPPLSGRRNNRSTQLNVVLSIDKKLSIWQNRLFWLLDFQVKTQ